MSETLQSFNPFNGEIVGEVTVTPLSAISPMVSAARKASIHWRSLSIDERATRLKKAAHSLRKNARKLGELLSQENGKPLNNGIGEVSYSGDYILQNIDEIIEALKPRNIEDDHTHSTLYYDPLGVCIAITPWNFPVSMPQWLVLPALAAGNAVILKPSEETPLSAQAYVEIMQSHLPENVLQIVHGAGEQGKALVEAEIDLIAFTGSRHTGKEILAIASQSLKRVILELGGKDPMFVLDSANIKLAAQVAAENGFENAGQACVSVERIFVDDTIADEFEHLLADKVSRIKLGPWNDPLATMGPMINERQRQIVIGHIDDAVAKGATIVCGGKDHPEKFVNPTVLSHVDTSMTIMNEETFGPVVAVHRFTNLDEAIKIANDNPYGLGASVFGKASQSEQVARRLEAGMIGINKSCFGAAGTPWVGAKQSGYGYHGSIEGHRQFTQVRVVSTSI